MTELESELRNIPMISILSTMTPLLNTNQVHSITCSLFYHSFMHSFKSLTWKWNNDTYHHIEESYTEGWMGKKRYTLSLFIDTWFEKWEKMDSYSRYIWIKGNYLLSSYAWSLSLW